MTEHWQANTVPSCRCPYCGSENDRAANAEGDVVQPGDISICLKCSGVLIFREDMTTRSAETGEIEKICAADPELAQTLYVYLEVHANMMKERAAGG